MNLHETIAVPAAQKVATATAAGGLVMAAYFGITSQELGMFIGLQRPYDKCSHQVSLLEEVFQAGRRIRETSKIAGLRRNSDISKDST